MRPSTETVHAPHSPTPQHSLGPSCSKVSRRRSSNVVLELTSKVWCRPLTVISMRIRSPMSHPVCKSLGRPMVGALGQYPEHRQAVLCARAQVRDRAGFRDQRVQRDRLGLGRCC